MSVDILTGLASVANEWRSLAVAWHVGLAVWFVMLVAGRRPSTRSLGHVLVAVVLSVSAVAWLSGNPFNGLVFAVLSGTLVWASARFPAGSAQSSTLMSCAAGAGLVVFGWTYPHFLNADSWTPYLYAAPLGLLPCPTLSLVIGVTLIVSTLQTTAWSSALVVAGLIYGGLGVFGLGVQLDWVLLGASATLAATVFHGGPYVQISIVDAGSDPGGNVVSRGAVAVAQGRHGRERAERTRPAEASCAR